MTKFQERVLKSMPDRWISIVELTDMIYPKRFSQSTQGLRRSNVRDAITILSREGYIISNKKGLWRPYDPIDYTAVIGVVNL